MNHGNTFSYTYSPPKNPEVLAIRKKYLPPEEHPRNPGLTYALCAGIGGTLLFGLGMLLSMEAIGQPVWLGAVLSLLGAAGMILAYPIYLK